MTATQAIGSVFLVAGAALSFLAGVGVLRLPDFYTRLHGAGLTDTLGAGLLLAGLMVHGGFSLVTVKLLMIMVFLAFTSPTASHALARAALSDPDNPRPLLHPETPPSPP